MSLPKNIWSQKEYYDKIKSWDDLSHPGIKTIAAYIKDLHAILDIGCGDGRKLTLLGSNTNFRVGTEVSTTPLINGNHLGVVALGEQLPFADHSFNAVTSFFVLEHTQTPQLVVEEALRVLKPKGLLCFLAPNYGAPNRASPNFQGSRLTKLITGFLSSFFFTNSLSWRQVTPQIDDINQFHSDLDTTVEPSLTSLIHFLGRRNMKLLHTSSYWDMETRHPKLHQKLFRVLSDLHLYPFIHWGPHLLAIAQKS